MKHWLIYTAIIVASWLLPNQSFAQDTDIGISGVGLLSVQRVDDTYVGGPYLSQGIGGFAPGFGAGVDVVTPSGLMFAGEFSTARFEAEQGGRTVPGSCHCNEQSFVGGSGTTHLHDSLVSGLIGYAARQNSTETHFLIGAALLLDHPTFDSRFGEHIDVGEDARRAALIGGIDVRADLSPRMALVFGGRYSYLQRTQSHEFLGIGPHVLRVGAGVRIRLN